MHAVNGENFMAACENEAINSFLFGSLYDIVFVRSHWWNLGKPWPEAIAIVYYNTMVVEAYHAYGVVKWSGNVSFVATFADNVEGIKRKYRMQVAAERHAIYVNSDARSS